MKVKITAIRREQKTSKAGKPYTSLAIQTQQYAERWISGFGNKGNEGWRENDEVEITVEDTGKFLNFKNEDGFTKARDVGNAEVKNALTLKVIPMLEKILAHLEGKPKLVSDDIELKKRIAGLVKQLEGEPVGDQKQWYGDMVQNHTSMSLELANKEDLQTIADELAKVVAQPKKTTDQDILDAIPFN
jgi:hypothetical protein